jgi:hypothetical protein
VTDARYVPAVTATVAAAGTATATLVPSVRTGQTVTITRITVASSDPNDAGQARVYRNSAAPGNFIDGTAAAAQDVADYSSPIHLYPGESLLVAWSASTVGATVTATAEGVVTGGF